MRLKWILLDYDKKRIIGPVVTVLVTILNGVFLPSTLSPSLVAVVWSAYVGGARAGMLAGMLAVIIKSQLEVDTAEFVAFAVSVAVVVLLVGYLKRQARITESLNGNLDKMRSLVDVSDFMLDNWAHLNEEGRLRKVRELRDRAGTLVTIVGMWSDLARKKDEIVHHDQVLQLARLVLLRWQDGGAGELDEVLSRLAQAVEVYEQRVGRA